MNRVITITALSFSLLLTGCFSQPPAPAVDRSIPVGSKLSGPFYTVKRGDTLYRIAIDHGLDYRDIVAWNNITNPADIKEGLVLRMAPPGASQAGTVTTQPVGVDVGVEARPLDQAEGTPPPPQASDGIKREPMAGKEPYSDEAYARLSKSGNETKAPEATTAQQTAEPDGVSWLLPSSGKIKAGFSESGNKGVDFSGKAGDPVLAAAEGKVVHVGSSLRGYGKLVIIKHNATYLSAYAHNREILVKEGQQVKRGQKIAEMGDTDADSVKLHFEIRKQGKPVDPMQYLPKQ